MVFYSIAGESEYIFSLPRRVEKTLFFVCYAFSFSFFSSLLSGNLWASLPGRFTYEEFRASLNSLNYSIFIKLRCRFFKCLGKVVNFLLKAGRHLLCLCFLRFSNALGLASLTVLGRLYIFAFHKTINKNKYFITYLMWFF